MPTEPDSFVSEPSIDFIPHFDKRAYQRRYNKSKIGKEVKRRYQHDNSKWTTDASYLARKIVAIDGEGLNILSGRRKGDHIYVMLAISERAPLIRKEGLRTKEILDYLFNNLSPKDINVIYGGSYDFNLWLVDLIEDELRYVYHSNYVSEPLQYGGYGIRWIKGKSFEIISPDKTIVIYDCISYFQCPFIEACDSYLGEYEGREQLVREKARRGNFQANELDSISDYNQLELRLLVQLLSELRYRLNKVGLRPRRWNSPGAIASSLFQREGVKKHRNTHIPEKVARAARYAYAGGRFELIKYGAVRKPVYEYDINSAYPRALLNVPSLAYGSWHHSTKEPPKEYAEFALYKVHYTGSRGDIPGPIYCRGDNGTIAYPLEVTNWIWSPEYVQLQRYCEKIDGSQFDLLECWYYVPTSDIKPFAFIDKLYRKRQELKAKGDGAHVGIKLGLNSLYGKLAQQVGWIAATEKHSLRIPAYHQLEWAGYTTSWCRAKVLEAALTNIDSVIAFETDALFTTEPLDVLCGEELGLFKVTEFKSLTYVQSGHYYGTKKNGEEIIKCRGIDKGFISRRRVETRLRRPENQRQLPAKLTRFYGAGIALARGVQEYWLKWRTEPKVLTLMPTGKRIHGDCFCTDGPLEFDVWHRTYCPVYGGLSHEYPIDWINPNPSMTELTDLRESENLFD